MHKKGVLVEHNGTGLLFEHYYAHYLSYYSNYFDSPSGILTPWYPDIYRDIPSESYDGMAWYMEVYDGYIRIMPPSSFHTLG